MPSGRPQVPQSRDHPSGICGPNYPLNQTWQWTIWTIPHGNGCWEFPIAIATLLGTRLRVPRWSKPLNRFTGLKHFRIHRCMIFRNSWKKIKQSQFMSFHNRPKNSNPASENQKSLIFLVDFWWFATNSWGFSLRSPNWGFEQKTAAPVASKVTCPTTLSIWRDAVQIRFWCLGNSIWLETLDLWFPLKTDVFTYIFIY